MKYTIENIRERYNNEEVLDFLFFWGHQPSKDGSIIKSCLSQWWVSRFMENDVIYKSAEHYMMEGKARVFHDPDIAAQIIATDNPKKAKALGRKISGYSDRVWNQHKYQIVKQANYLKFSQNARLKEFLIATTDKILVEASPVDFIWGIGMSEDNREVKNPNEWKGPNLLGFALMEVRDQINREV